MAQTDYIPKPVIFGTTKLGVVQTIEPMDADVNDPEMPGGWSGHLAREALYDLLQAHPKCPTEEMAPQAWILTVLRRICETVLGKRDEAFEQIVFRRYLRHFGSSQMCQITGAPFSSAMDLNIMFGGRGETSG